MNKTTYYFRKRWVDQREDSQVVALNVFRSQLNGSGV